MKKYAALLGLLIVCGLGVSACEPAPPPATSGPTLAAADFRGRWTGVSAAGKPLDMTVTSVGQITYLYDGRNLSAGAPKFTGNTMWFSITGGAIYVSKLSATELDWRYSGMLPSSQAKLGKVADVARLY